MDVQEEAKQFGHVGEISHMTVSRRDTVLNDIKGSTVQGIVSLILSLLSVFCIFYGIYRSYLDAGNAGIQIGGLMAGALALATASILTALSGLKNREKIRHYMEKRAILISGLAIAVLAELYIFGLILGLRA